MALNEDLISVIVPVYKMEDRLEKCINSIVNQDYTNLDIILVNDGSPDKSGDICDSYAKNDMRITVIHKENGGTADALNCGINAVKGKYVAFVDADDYVTKDYISYMYELLKKHGTKMAICGIARILQNGAIVDDSTHEEVVLESKNALERMLYANGIGCSTWGKLFDIKLFDNIRYPIDNRFEEIATTYKLMDKCDFIACGLFVKYYYVLYDGSKTQSVFTEDKLKLIDTTYEMCNYIEKKYPELHSAANRRRAYANLSTYRQLVESNDMKFKQVEKQIRKSTLEIGREVFFDKRAPKRDRMGILALTFGKKAFKTAWSVYKTISQNNE